MRLSASPAARCSVGALLSASATSLSTRSARVWESGRRLRLLDGRGIRDFLGREPTIRILDCEPLHHAAPATLLRHVNPC